MSIKIDDGRKILALDENEIYIVTQDIKSSNVKMPNCFDFLAKKEDGGIIRGFSFREEELKYTRLY